MRHCAFRLPPSASRFGLLPSRDDRRSCERIAMLTMASHKPSLSLERVAPAAAAAAVAQLHMRIDQAEIGPTAKSSTGLTARLASMLK